MKDKSHHFFYHHIGEIYHRFRPKSAGENLTMGMNRPIINRQVVKIIR